MLTQFIRFTTSDSLILQGLLYVPGDRTGRAILHVHGMAGNFYENRFLDAMAQRFTDEGWALLSINTRGHDIFADVPLAGDGERYRRVGNAYEIFEESVHDLGAAIDYLEGVGYCEIVLQGHSLGAAKAAYYLATAKDKRISRLVLASPPDMVGLAEAEGTFERLRETAQEMMAAGRGEELVAQKWWDGYWLSAATFLDLSLRGNPVDIFNTYAPGERSALAEVAVPTLAVFGERDDAAVLPCQEALNSLALKASGCPRFDTAIIAGAPHSYFGCEAELSTCIAQWLTKAN